MKFLIIEQDLRISGSSQGIISRSFLSKLRVSFPDSRIDVVYLKQSESNDQLELLPVNNIQEKVLNLKYPFFTKLINRLYWRIFHVSLIDEFVHKQYAKEISQIDFEKYDHIFIRSGGLKHEMLLGSEGLPVLKKGIINFHEPFPTFWCSGANDSLKNLDLFRIKKMLKVVEQSKTCMATRFLAKDMQFLYGTRKYFYSLPHQFCNKVFDFSDTKQVRPNTKKITIAYHGALQFGRDIDNLLIAYKELVNENQWIKENSEFVLRLKSNEIYRIEKEYKDFQNIVPLHGLNFSNSYYEQAAADLNIILENGPVYCSVLVGKAPMLALINKPILTISPIESEIREVVKNDMYIATCGNKEEIKSKLENLILAIKEENKLPSVFGDYFSDENFKRDIENIIYQKKSIY